MKIQTIKDAVLASSQEWVGDSLGVTQGAIQQALANDRKIFIVTDDEGNTSAFQIRAAFKTKPDLEAVTKMILEAITQMSEEK